jgi:hypothetical protein
MNFTNRAFSSPGAVCSVYLRHDLEIFDKRLKEFEALVVQDRSIPIEARVIAMERKKEKREIFVKLKLTGYLHPAIVVH